MPGIPRPRPREPSHASLMQWAIRIPVGECPISPAEKQGRILQGPIRRLGFFPAIRG